MITQAQFEKLRVVTLDPEEALAYEQQLYFEVPRKTGAQMAPAIERMKTARKSEQQSQLRFLRRMMKRARIPDVPKQIDHLIEMDKSESIVPHGEVSKRIYHELFHTRVFDLYGTPVVESPEEKKSKEPKVYNARKEAELRNKAYELGIEYVNLKQEEVLASTLANYDRDGVPDIFGENVADLKKPVIQTAPWEVGYEEMKVAPIGTAIDPGPVYKSQGNEKYFAYRGEWSRGYMSGAGMYKYADGKTYVGKFAKNWPDGEGRAEYAMGGSYDGEWKFGRYHSEKQSEEERKAHEDDPTRVANNKAGSVLETVVGSVYDGEFEYGRRDGIGTLTLPCGLKYEGKFKDGKPHGRGKMTSALTGYSFEGTFVKGTIEGIGTLITPKKERVVRMWLKAHPQDPPLLISGCIKLHLQDIEDAREKEKNKLLEIYSLRRGLQLRAYINDIRTNLHESRAREKRERQNKAIADMKEAKRKLHEARVKALAGET